MKRKSRAGNTHIFLAVFVCLRSTAESRDQTENVRDGEQQATKVQRRDTNREQKPEKCQAVKPEAPI